MKIKTRPIAELFKPQPEYKVVAGEGAFFAVLPVPVSVNNLYRPYRGQMTISEPARLYKAQVKEILLRARVVPLKMPVVASIRIYRRIPRGDADNFIKILFDALNGCAYDDDDQIVDFHVYRRDDKKAPRCEVTVAPWQGEEEL